MKCRNCETELTRDEKRDCFRCLQCNPIPKTPIVHEKKETKYVDVAMTEARVREICRDVLEDWHVQKPTHTQQEIADLVDPKEPFEPSLPELTWRQQAKEFDIPLAQPTGGARKKIDVLADIEKKRSA